MKNKPGFVLLIISLLTTVIYLPVFCQQVTPPPMPGNFPTPPKTFNKPVKPGKKEKIEVRNAELLQTQNQMGSETRKLSGNVILHQQDALMYCDSAIMYMEMNMVDAAGHIHIKKGDTIDIWGDKLLYFGDSKTGTISGGVKLRDRETLLKTPTLDYDLENDIGIFNQGGELTKDKSVLTSKAGTYYHQKSEAVFTGDVVFKDDKTTMYADSLKWNTNTGVATFITKTRIISKESDITTDSGYYDTKLQKAVFGSNPVLHKGKTTLTALNLEYDADKEKGNASGNVVYRDSAENITMLSNKMHYQQDSSYVKAYDDPLLIKVDKKDTLYLSADTLLSFQVKRQYDTIIDTLQKNDSVRILMGYQHVKFLKGRVSGICDSLYFSYQDSTIRLFQNPVLWVDTTQFKADSIYIFLKNEVIDEILLNGSCLIISQSDSGVFNQVKGREITGHFSNEKLTEMEVDGNAESIYYIKDDSSAYVGANKTLCSHMNFYFKDDSLQKILFLNSPEGSFTPMRKINPATFILEGFRWMIGNKPKSKFDIVRNNNSFQIEILKELEKVAEEKEVKTEELQKEGE